MSAAKPRVYFFPPPLEGGRDSPFHHGVKLLAVHFSFIKFYVFVNRIFSPRLDV